MKEEMSVCQLIQKLGEAEAELKTQDATLCKLSRDNRTMRRALREIIGIRFWNCSADYSPKVVAQKALEQTEH